MNDETFAKEKLVQGLFDTTIDTSNFKSYKDQLLSPKSGDKFSIDINIKNGQRYYNVTWGRKWATFRQSFGYGVIKLSVTNAKTHLKNYYWRKAASDAHGRFCVTQPYYVADTDSYHIDKPKRRRLPKNWREDY